MRRKLIGGAALVLLAGLAAGEYWLNRTGAQDGPKAADSPKKIEINLFDILKKDIEAKKQEKQETPPSIPVPPPLPAKDGVPIPPIVPPLAEEKPKEPIAPPKVTDVKPAEAPPVKPSADPPPSILVPPPIVIEQKASSPPQPPRAKDEPPVFSLPSKIEIAPPTVTLPGEQPRPKDSASPKPPTVVHPDLPTLKPMQPILDEVSRLKNCQWSLQVEVVDGLTVVKATVNKKHDFKIVCKSLDLQTGKGTLKATGTVLITSATLIGNCEALSIPLAEDRLVLEGGAEITIQKSASAISDAVPAAFHLKSDTLDLRVSDLSSAKFIPTSRQPLRRDEAVTQAAVWPEPEPAASWSAYGKLVRHESKVAGPEWRLEKANGEVIAYLVTAPGKSLSSYVGRTVAVYGAPERKMAGYNNVLRVSHVAAP